MGQGGKGGAVDVICRGADALWIRGFRDGGQRPEGCGVEYRWERVSPGLCRPFQYGHVFALRILTHAEYNKENWKHEL
jgi:hypothetical protein